MKQGVKRGLRFLRTVITKTMTDARTGAGATAGEAAELGEKRAALGAAIADSELGSGALEAAARRESEALAARAAEGAARLEEAARARDAKRGAAATAATAAAALSPAVLAELSGSIAALEAGQRAERQRMSDCVAACLLKVSEHKQSSRVKLDAAAAALITAKNRLGAAAAEREARMVAGVGP